MIAFLAVILAGCSTPRQMTLFSGNGSSFKLPPLPVYTIEPGDVLGISFSAIDKEAVAPYNSSGTEYTVKDDGTVNMPVLGDIYLVGMSTDSAEMYLTNLVSSQVREPIVRMMINNASVTILGEVQRPARLLAIHPITLIEALGDVGGLTANARCKDVLVQRRENGQTKQYRINLLTDELLHSPCYYLQKGDVVYVAPLYAR